MNKHLYTKHNTLIQFSELSKQYKQRQIFSGVSVEFREAESYLLTGKNGSGKSTLLRVMAGLLKPNSGNVSFFKHEDEAKLSWKRHQYKLREAVMYLHQTPYLFDGTVEKNLEYALRLTIAPESRQQKIQEALYWSGLESLSKSPAKQLSGGEKQRVALARAWLRNAKVLLLDEPTVNLDQSSRLKTLKLLGSLKKSGVSLMIACHDYEEFSSISDGIINLDGGLLSKI